MRVKTILMTAFIISSIATYALAAEEHGHQEHKGSMMEQEHKGSMTGHMEEEASEAVEMGNKICPISGETVGAMGPAVKYEYKGKIYNLCCAGCLSTFKDDPEKYVKIIEESMEQQKIHGEDLDHDHSKHMMGEMDSHAIKDMHGKKESHSGEVSEDQKKAKGEVQEIHLEAYQYGYSPERVVVKKGEVVKILATSRDVPHGIFIKEYGISEKVEKGKVKEIEFVADKAGEFDILCSVYCGRGHHSMKSKLVVE
ncbi:MAG: cupredoxin domain-containing protein [Candidatus Zapsychrus exili]|nr:cupredoxin domain-containing protein [Candidatus Zapsychrus exili]